MPVVIFPSNIEGSPTINALKLDIVNFGVQQKWIKLENIMETGKIVMQVAQHMMPVVISPSNMEVQPTINALKLAIVNFGVQRKWIQLEIIKAGKIVMTQLVASEAASLVNFDRIETNNHTFN